MCLTFHGVGATAISSEQAITLALLGVHKGTNSMKALQA